MALTAPSLDSTSGYTLGGATIGLNASFSPTSKQIAITNSNDIVIDIPAGSGLLIQAK
jgi:hypothetical protein